MSWHVMAVCRGVAVGKASNESKRTIVPYCTVVYEQLDWIRLHSLATIK
jgi:hypothetical protein